MDLVDIISMTFNSMGFSLVIIVNKLHLSIRSIDFFSYETYYNLTVYVDMG